jgi:hypothetical protein
MNSGLASWFGSLGLGLLVAVPGAVLAGWLAPRAVDWLQVPSREGASGYFVVFMGLGGALLGLLVGIVVSRYLGTSAGGSFARALGVGLGVHTLLLFGIAGLLRMRADVPPTIDGKPLHLLVEVSWPATMATALRNAPGAPYVVLASDDGSTLRERSEGPLWREDMRIDGERVVLPGAVEIFTSRGMPTLLVNTGQGDGDAGFRIPLPGHPGEAALAWSPWLERGNPTWGKPPPGFALRYRVITRDAPVRSERAGPFEIRTVADGFSVVRNADGTVQPQARAHFELRVDGVPVQLHAAATASSPADTSSATSASGAANMPKPAARIDAVATLPGDPTALLVLTDARYAHGDCRLLRLVAGKVQVNEVDDCGEGLVADLLPPAGSTEARAAAAPARAPAGQPRVHGRLDRETFAVPGLYLFSSAVLDTRTLALHRLPNQRAAYQLDRVPPLSLAPDEHRFARISDSGNGPVLAEIDLRDGTRRDLPVDDAPVPTGDWQDVDAGWFATHFAWVQDGTDGYRVTQRQDAGRVARRGRLGNSNGYREYRLAPVDAGMRDAFVAFLLDELGGRERPTDEGSFAREVDFAGGTLHIGLDGQQLVVFMLTAPHTELVATVAARFDAALASGAYDAHFLPMPGAR